MTSHSEDEAFENFIEVMDVEDSCKKENKENNILTDNVKTKSEQIDKIIAFVKKHNEELVGKEKYSLLWNSLVDELNALGPPTNSAEKWKRIWSVYKYNNKKRLPKILGDESVSHQGQLPHSLVQHSVPIQADYSNAHSILITVDNSNAHPFVLHSKPIPADYSNEQSIPISADDSNACPFVLHSSPILVDNSNANKTGFESEVLKHLSLVTFQQKIIIKKLDEQNALLKENSKKN